MYLSRKIRSVLVGVLSLGVLASCSRLSQRPIAGAQATAPQASGYAVSVSPAQQAAAQSFSFNGNGSEAEGIAPALNLDGGKYPFSKFGPYKTTTSHYLGYLVYHPKDLQRAEQKFPIITWGNPSFFDSWCFYKLLHLLASHGFVVVASHNVMTGSGKEMIAGIDLMLRENEDPKSKFYQKLDPGMIGALGHSQGGLGTVNTVAKDPRVVTSVPLHPGLDVNLTARYPRERAERGPMLIITGELDVFSPPPYVKQVVYDRQISQTVYGVKKMATHYGPVSVLGGDSSVENYVVAWFLLQLSGRSELESYFFGQNCKLCDDRAYRVDRK